MKNGQGETRQGPGGFLPAGSVLNFLRRDYSPGLYLKEKLSLTR